ncbi:MAG: DUF2764 domain-containing protein [Bacteroidaceae bacterium]|nr:DUF2764 domain-containing protein [Bacteroidaceae bacterium]
MSSKYYYLIAGLAEISLDDDRLPYSVDTFREEIFPSLSASDRRLVGLALEQYDRRNLLTLLEKAKGGEDLQLDDTAVTGSLTFEQLVGVIEAVRAGESADNAVPEYISRFTKEYLDDEWQSHSAFAEDRLSSLFYEYASTIGNGFVRDWFSFNLDLNNIQTALTARKHSLPVQNLIVGDGEVAEALRTSGAKDWGLSQTVGFFDRLVRIQDEADLTAREREIDMIKWNWMEEHTFFHYFTVEKLFAFLVRLDIAGRWLKLDKEKGQEMFRSLIASLKSGVEVPAEFAE